MSVGQSSVTRGAVFPVGALMRLSVFWNAMMPARSPLNAVAPPGPPLAAAPPPIAFAVPVFAIEHQGYRDQAAMQVKLDEIIRALDADRSKIGIEERAPKEIDSVRDAVREREGRRRVG